jgi:hypothetical protein
MFCPMKPRASFLMASLVLVICLVCPLAEMFDQWDHTLQTGNDSEYALVILALCVGISFLLKRLIPSITLTDTEIKAARALRACPLIPRPTHWFSVIPIYESPPAAALRI